MRLASSRLLSEQENLSSAVAALVKGRVPSLYQDHLPRAAPTQRRAQVQQKALVGPDRRRAAPPLESGPAPALRELRHSRHIHQLQRRDDDRTAFPNPAAAPPASKSPC